MNANEKIEWALVETIGPEMDIGDVNCLVRHLKIQGLTIVPIEPTEEMISGGDMEFCTTEVKDIIRIYKTMLANGSEK